jgi:phenylacetate-CoA ligase
MTEAFSHSPEAAEARLTVAQHSLDRLKTVPALAARYDGHDKILALEDIAAVPPLIKDDLNVALAHLEPKAGEGATWLFQSGGSTGAPKVGYAPTGFYMAGVHAQWAPLDRDDVFVNAWGAGRMWGAHFLAAALADLCGCQVIALGSVTPDEYADWLDFFVTRKVTAIGGTPSVLRLWFANARAAGITLPSLRKVLWLGEAWQPQLETDMAVVAPEARRWGMFGSTETWVVGTNTPDCPDDTFHVLPEQLVHVGELLDFTTLNPEMLNPVLRYQTGDAGAIVACPCGRPGGAMRVLGRRDSVVQVRGLGLHVDEIVAQVEQQPGVSRAQVVITENQGRALSVEVLVLAGADAAASVDTEQLRRDLLSSTFTLSTAFLHDPGNFRVCVTDALVSNDRTGKTSNFVVREQP